MVIKEGTNTRVMPLHEWEVLLLVIFFILNILGLLPWLQCAYLSADVQQTVYQAKLLGHGYVPHRDIFCHHILGYLYPFYLIDIFIPLTSFNLKILAVLLQYVYGLSIFLFLAYLYDRKTAWFGFFITITAGWLVGWEGVTFNTQNYYLPLYVVLLTLVNLAVLLSNRTCLLAACFLAGYLLIGDQRQLFFSIFLLLPPLLNPHFKRPKILIQMFSAFVLLPFIFLGYLCWNGALAELKFQILDFPLFFRNRGMEELVLYAPVRLIISGFLREWTFVFPALIGLFITLKHETRLVVRLNLLIGLIIGTLLVMIGGREFPNYLLYFSYIFIISTASGFYYLSKIHSRDFKVFFFGVVFLSLLSIVKPFYYTGGSGIWRLPKPSVIPELAKFIKENTVPKAKILVWGGYAPRIYLESERVSWFRDVSLISVIGANFGERDYSKQGIAPEMLKEFKDGIVTAPPEMIIMYKLKPHCYLSGCNDCGTVTHNTDLDAVHGLDFLREVIGSKYTQQVALQNEADEAIVFKLNNSLEIR